MTYSVPNLPNEAGAKDSKLHNNRPFSESLPQAAMAENREVAGIPGMVWSSA